MKLKLSREEISVIKNNLVALDFMTYIVNFDHNLVELKITNTGKNAYITILYMLQKRQILNGPSYSDSQIKNNNYNFLKNLMLDQKFIEIIDLKFMLTRRGMEHIYVMFLSKQPIYSKLSKLIRLGKV